MNEDELKTNKSVTPPEKNGSGDLLSQKNGEKAAPSIPQKASAPPQKPSAPPKPPRPPKPPKSPQTKVSEQNKKTKVSEQNPKAKVEPETKVDEEKEKNIVDDVKNVAKEDLQTEKNDINLEEEIEIAKLQCEDDDNAGVIAGENEVIEKSYKAGLSDQDKQRKKRNLKRLLLLLLLLLLFAGSVTATYFIVKNKTEYVPEFYDNVAIEMNFNMERSEDRMPGDNLLLIRPVEVLVKANTEEINYDIVALGIKVTAKFTETGEDCSNIIDVGIYDIDQIYQTDELEYTGGSFVRCGQDIMLYYKKVLEPGENEKLINAIRINANTTNEYARKEISIKVEIFAVYPNPAQIRADTSEFKNAPEGWVEEVYEKMTNIFKERAKNK